MAPARATVKQAIEFLKIHQLRRENAAIYQELQNLRTDVSDLHTSNDDTDKNLDQLKEDLNGQSNTIRTQYDHLANKVDMLERQKKDVENEHKTMHQAFGQELEDIRHRVMQKADKVELEVIRNCVDDQLQACLPPKESDTFKSTSRIYDSIEGNNKRDSPVVVISTGAQCQTLGVESDLCSATETANSTISHLTIQQQNKLRKSTVPDDVDLDEAAAEISDAGHNMDLESCNDSLVMLPYDAEEQDQQIEEILSLKQDSSETLLAYIRRCYEIINRMASTSEDIVIRRSVIGLVSPKHREIFAKWLNSTSWSKQNLEDIASLYGIDRSELVSIRCVELQAVDKTCTRDCVTEIAAPGLRKPDTRQKPGKGKLIDCKKNDKKIEPRRSQRIAAKSQIKSCSAIKGGRVTHTHAEMLNTGSPRPTTKSKGKVELDIPRKKGQRCRMSAQQTETQTHGPPVTGEISTRHQKNPMTEMLQANHGLRSPLEVDRLHQTPAKHIQLYKPPMLHPYILADPASPLLTRRTAVQQRRLQSIQANPDTTVPSPYNPKPQLVPGTDQARTRPHALTSDSEVFLPRAKLQQNPERSNFIEPRKKKRRLALPPPPQIPILSTSTEEDRRFDRW